ncbi:MAG TPA: response regulator [Planctomycetota bacterium]|nr:response regulator [Planctomycetota bacterium]
MSDPTIALPTDIARGAAKVLLVDDCGTIAYLLGRAAKPRLWDLRHAVDGPEAFAFLDAGWIPDVMVVDLLMPMMDGFEVMRRVRENPAWRSIRLLMLTGYASEARCETAFSVGAAAFEAKPPANAGYGAIVERIAHLVALDPAADAAVVTADALSGSAPLDLSLLAVAKRCFSGGAVVTRAAMIAVIAAATRCDDVRAAARLDALIAGFYVEQIGFGPAADIIPGPNLSTLVMQVLGVRRDGPATRSDAS